MAVGSASRIASPVKAQPDHVSQVRARSSAASSRRNAWVFLLGLVIFMPYPAALYFGPVKLTPAKILLTLLFVPALVQFLSGVSAGRRKVVSADVLVLAATVWMLSLLFMQVGAEAVKSLASLGIELLGSYLFGRVYVYGVPAVLAFTKALKIATSGVIACALLDVATGHYFINDLASDIVHLPPTDASDYHFHRLVMGRDFFRAASTFDHPILYGTFCTLAAAIILYSPGAAASKIAFMITLGAGCVLSMSSAPIIGFVLLLVLWGYDRVFQWFRGRWRLMGTLLALVFAGVSVGTHNPLGWFIRNLTLDPVTGYFRLIEWDAAMKQISLNPISGTSGQKTGIYLLDNSVDCFWLGRALNFGLVDVALLLAAAASVAAPFAGFATIKSRHKVIGRLCTGYSIVLGLLLFISLSVYFWSSIWLFIVVCVGVRASLKEQAYALSRGSRPPAPSPSSGFKRSGAISAIKGAPGLNRTAEKGGLSRKTSATGAFKIRGVARPGRRRDSVGQASGSSSSDDGDSGSVAPFGTSGLRYWVDYVGRRA